MGKHAGRSELDQSLYVIIMSQKKKQYVFLSLEYNAIG